MCGSQPCDQPTCTWSEAHRSSCEARTVMHWPGEQRKEFYNRVKTSRGADAVAALIADVNREWRKVSDENF